MVFFSLELAPLLWHQGYMHSLYQRARRSLLDNKIKPVSPFAGRCFNLWATREAPILKKIDPEYSLEGLMMNWSSSTLATWCREPTHWKRPWCWERLRAGGERGDRRDDSIVSPPQWTWIWANSGTGKPGMLQFMGSQRVRHGLATEHFGGNTSIKKKNLSKLQIIHNIFLIKVVQIKRFLFLFWRGS